MKKCISLLMVILLMLSVVFCVPVSAASNSDGNFYYELSYDKTYYILYDTISGIKGKVKIPKEFNGLPVKVIDDQAFWDCTEITSVSVYSNIEKIGGRAFGHCEKLSDIFVSDYVDYIHSTAFDNTAYYKNSANWISGVFYVGNHFIKAETDVSGIYRIKEGTKTIAEGAFAECDELKAVIIPDSVNAIYDNTFEGCSKLDHIYIPEGVVSIGMDAFAGTRLKYAHLPSTLKRIDECAFPKMTAIYIPANVELMSLWAINSGTGMVFGEAGSYAQISAEEEELPFTPISEHTHNIETVKYATASVDSCGLTFTKCDGCGQIFEYNVTAQKTPAKVTLKEIENNEYGVYLTFETVSGADAYKIYRRNYGSDDWSSIGVSKAGYYYDSTAKNNKKYQYTVKAINEAGTGASSKTRLTIKFVTMPEFTGLVNNTAGVKITWKKVSYADRYYIYRFNETERKWERIKRISSGKTTSYVDETAKSGKRYYYKIKAYNDGYLSGDIGGGAPAIERLSRPSLSSVTSTKSGVKFTWKKVTGAEGYIVYRKTGSKGDWKAIKTIESGTIVSYTDKTAKKGTTYYYSVRATKYGFNSAYNTTGLKIKDKY